MAKIGRNQPCLCGSGKKYKHCCLPAQKAGAAPAPAADLKISLMAEIEKAQQAAAGKEVYFRELGVFIFFTGTNGDAWLLEMTEQDAVQLAADGSALALPIDEQPDTIEVNWSHTFTVKERKLCLTAYADKQETVLAWAPCQQISAAIRRLRKLYSDTQLKQVHVPQADARG